MTRSPSGIIGTSWPWRVYPEWNENNEVISQAIRDVIFTAMGERKMNPDFGSEVISTVFENRGVLLEALAERTISFAISKNLQSIKIVSIDVTEGENDTDPVIVSVGYVHLGSYGNVEAEVRR